MSLSPLPERDLEPPENYDMEPEPCSKCALIECPKDFDPENKCPILVEYDKKLDAEYKGKKQEEEMQRQEDKERDPEECPMCNDHPTFDEIAHGQYECRNCGTVQDEDGKILEEGEEPSPDTDDDLWDNGDD